MKRIVRTLNPFVLLHAPISQILKIIHSGLSGIRTHGLCLVTGAPSLPKSDFFPRRRISNDPLNLFDDSWRNKYGCQQSILRPLKGTGLCNRLFLRLGASPVTQQSSVLMSLTLFLRSISFRSEMSSRVMAVLESHPQRSKTCKYQNIGKSSFSRG